MGLLTLIGQSVAMFTASMVVGMLPLFCKGRMSDRTLESIQVFGMGLLVGAALAIIIPEGVETLYAAEPSAHVVGMSLLGGFALMLLIESLHSVDAHAARSSPSGSPIPLPNLALTRPSVENLAPHPPHDADVLPEDDPSHPMLPKDTDECETHAAAHGLSATLGLVIHGAADGIAIGASSLTGNAKLSMVVFLAVIVHKGPAAFGFATMLISLHLSPAQVRRRLLIFSAAAPTGAIATYGVAQLLGSGTTSGSGRYSLGWWTGVVLLFSGGSFLYISTILAPLSEPVRNDLDHCHHPHHLLHEDNVPKLPKIVRTSLVLAGMILPLILTALVGQHGH